MKITFIDKNTQKEISIFKLITEADVKVMSSGNIIKTLDGKRYLIESIEYLISENGMEVMIYITENICNSLLIFYLFQITLSENLVHLIFMN